MGLTYANIELVSGDDLSLFTRGYIEGDSIKRVQVKALVDSGTYMLAINDRIKQQLDLRKIDEQMAELADGQMVKLEIVGPIEIRFDNRRAILDAMVVPGDAEVLLGAIPMESLDVILDPVRQQLVVNPESPDIAKKSLK